MEHACASSEVTWRPGTNMVSIGPWGDRGTQSLLPSPLLREKATEESGPAPKAHPFRVYRLPVLQRLSQKQLLLVSVSTSVSTCGAMNQHPFCQLPPGVTSPRPEESANKKPQQTTIPLAWGGPCPAPLGREGCVCPLTMVWVYSWSLGSSYGRFAFFSRSDRNPWNTNSSSELLTQWVLPSFTQPFTPFV